MSSVLFLLCIFLAGLMLIALFVKWYTALCYRLIVTNKDDALGIILSTREVPRVWRYPTLEKVARAPHNPFGRWMQRVVIWRYARRIRGLISLTKANRRMSEEQKQADVATLEEVAKEWSACRILEELL